MTEQRYRPVSARSIFAVALAILTACSKKEMTAPAAQVQPSGASFSCASDAVVALAVGEVRTALPGTNICLRTDASAEYMLHAFFGSTVASAQTQVSVTGFDITTPSGGATMSAVGPSGGLATSGDLSTPAGSLDLAFRTYERTVLAPRMAAARSAMRGGALRSVAPVPNVGDIIRLNAGSAGCDAPRYRFGRIAAVTNRAIVVSDTGNPSGGFTDAEYQSIGVTFDTLVDPVDQNAFGAPTDIDQNGRIIIFYSRVVNELTPAESQGVVSGFFNPRDLFPQVASGGIQGCAGSNMAEMFYLLVPDPAGTINGNVRSKTTVQQLTVAVIAHEYQHLINAARRLYINDADAFEEVWLNEGLSHIAEELLFYRASGLSSRSSLDVPKITASQKTVDAFNQYQSSNFGRYALFLEKPETSSPYADNDSLSNRGAIWSFLRYAADRAATSDGTIFQQLVNSKTTGIQNLKNVFGAGVLDQIRDWSISVYTDDLTSTVATFQQPSWHFRSIYSRIREGFPLRVRRLANAVSTTETLRGGGSLYTTFAVPAGVTAGAAWSVVSPSVSMSIVRTK